MMSRIEMMPSTSPLERTTRWRKPPRAIASAASSNPQSPSANVAFAVRWSPTVSVSGSSPAPSDRTRSRSVMIPGPGCSGSMITAAPTLCSDRKRAASRSVRPGVIVRTSSVIASRTFVTRAALRCGSSRPNPPARPRDGANIPASGRPRSLRRCNPTIGRERRAAGDPPGDGGGHRGRLGPVVAGAQRERVDPGHTRRAGGAAGRLARRAPGRRGTRTRRHRRRADRRLGRLAGQHVPLGGPPAAPSRGHRTKTRRARRAPPARQGRATHHRPRRPRGGRRGGLLDGGGLRARHDDRAVRQAAGRLAQGAGSGTDGTRGADAVLRREEPRELHAVGRRELLEAQPGHLARAAHDPRGALEQRAAREDELERHARADGQPGEAGPDGEAADAEVLGDELALLARRAVGVELAQGGGQRDREARGLAPLLGGDRLGRRDGLLGEAQVVLAGRPVHRAAQHDEPALVTEHERGARAGGGQRAALDGNERLERRLAAGEPGDPAVDRGVADGQRDFLVDGQALHPPPTSPSTRPPEGYPAAPPGAAEPMTSVTRRPNSSSMTTTSPRAMGRPLTRRSTGSPAMRFSVMIDPGPRPSVSPIVIRVRPISTASSTGTLCRRARSASSAAGATSGTTSSSAPTGSTAKSTSTGAAGDSNDCSAMAESTGTVLLTALRRR